MRSNPEDGSREERKGYAKGAEFLYILCELCENLRDLRVKLKISGLLRHAVHRNNDEE